MAYVSAYTVVSQHFVQANRTFKPFNPLLGETFEVVTSKYKAISEKVSHKPTILAMHCEGPSFELEKTVEVESKFTGKAFTVTIPNYSYLKLKQGNGHLMTGEDYKFNTAQVYVNAIGTAYVDPMGVAEVINTTTGERCDIKYEARGFRATNKEKFEGLIKDQNNDKKYKISG